ncbi:PAXNEB-domain-containing protein [Gonapodya prolifera JEL478]|uniref:Elongator complex protein 4 n=1 Tax=Gonapodya prolifera (strain JEL478) TaxID=1344416 RepID=A0A139A2K1_GONPJ|nr:PAXNEB-domain-containing protein [Gonapodya prolifera JEL478]|eukprot:KXS10992.1 PAXNEB-domain-containing protein [Gonapodya prolifera JEL478]
MKSSFRRVKASNSSTTTPLGNIIGVKRSPAGIGVLSTGTEIDSLLGGGVPLGSVSLLLEDRLTSYTDIICGCFIAEGVVGESTVYVAGDDVDAFFGNLPAALRTPNDQVFGREEESEHRPESSQEEMTIAWRYASLPRYSAPNVGQPVAQSAGKRVAFNQSSASRSDDGELLHSGVRVTFDFGKKMPPETIHAAGERVLRFDVAPRDEMKQVYDPFEKILHDIAGVAPLTSSSTSGTPVAPLRIVIRSLLGVAWLSALSHNFGTTTPLARHAERVYRFLHSLRVLVRDRHASAIVTMPTHLFDAGSTGGLSQSLLRRLEHAADGVIELESFDGTMRSVHPAFKQDYHGLVLPHKLHRPGTLTHLSRTPELELRNLAFRLRRKRFSVEPFHLPPDLSEPKQATARSSQDQIVDVRTSFNKHKGLHGGGDQTNVGSHAKKGIASGQNVDF